MKKRILAITLSVLMAGTALAGCGSSSKNDEEGPTLSAEDADKDLDYTYGEGVTFHSNEPVTYSMLYSDHENYPYNVNFSKVSH